MISYSPQTLTGWRTAKSLGYVRHVDHNGLDAIAFALYLGHDLGHLVPVEGIHHITVHVVTHLWKNNTHMMQNKILSISCAYTYDCIKLLYKVESVFPTH